uniref:Uncharacterized protein n=1 Tax=Rhipicephalus pulchellus TaxID=72859 RepID=L7LUI8_RHIPC
MLAASAMASATPSAPSMAATPTTTPTQLRPQQRLDSELYLFPLTQLTVSELLERVRKEHVLGRSTAVSACEH